MSAGCQASAIGVDGARRYDRWRRQWCAGVRNRAIDLLCHGGMTGALALTAPPARPPSVALDSTTDTPPEPSSQGCELTRAAARMIHELLVREAGEHPHA